MKKTPYFTQNFSVDEFWVDKTCLDTLLSEKSQKHIDLARSAELLGRELETKRNLIQIE